MKKCITMIAALFVFVVNPMIVVSGCGVCTGSGPQYNYDERDLAREVLKVPTMQTIELPDGTSLEVTLAVDMASLSEDVQRQLELYGFRQELTGDWMQTAQACSYDIGKEVRFEARVDVTRLASDGERELLISERVVNGWYRISSTTFGGGELILSTGSAYDPTLNEVFLSYQTPNDGDASRAQLVSVYLDEFDISYSSVGDYGFDQPDMTSTTQQD